MIELLRANVDDFAEEDEVVERSVAVFSEWLNTTLNKS